VTSGLPAGAIATFTPATVTNTLQTSTLKVLTLGLTTPGVYNLTISGTDGTLTNTTQVQLIVGAINNACIQQMGYYWVTGAIPQQTGTFTAEWDATPLLTGTENANVGLTNVNMQTVDGSAVYTDLDVAARFNASGNIDARNGSAFGVPAVAIPYTGGLTYHFRAVVNVPAATYSIYVTPPGQSEITIGTNWAFRTGAAVGTPASINYWDATAEVGSVALCNMVIETPNFALSATPDTQTVRANYSTTYTVTMTPIDGYAGNVALSASGLPAGATAGFNPATVTSSVTPSTLTISTTAATASGTYPITITGTDGTLTNVAYTELTINPPCVAPAAASQSVSTDENTALSVTLAGTVGSGCANTDILGYAVTASPSHGVLTGTVPNIEYTPTAGYTGSDSFTFTVTDANAIPTTSTAATVSITVAAPVSAAPVLSSLSPALVVAGAPATTLTVNGSGFVSGSTVVLWNGAARTTTFVNATQVTAAITASDLSTAGLASVTVSNPGPSGGVSAPLTMAIDSNVQISVQPLYVSYTVAHGQSVPVQLSFHHLPAGEQMVVDCYNLPAAANCSYDAPTQVLTFTTGLSTPVGTYQILVVDTLSPSATASSKGHFNGLLCGLLGLPLGLFWFGRKRRRWLYPAAGILGLLLIVVAGCSSGSNSTTNAVSGQVSTTLSLTVN